MAKKTPGIAEREALFERDAHNSIAPLKAKRKIGPQAIDALPSVALARKVLRHKRWPLFTTAMWRTIEARLRLSGREFAIVIAMFEDLPDKEIAKRIGMNYGTLRTHFERLNRKLRVRSRPSLLFVHIS